MSEYEIPMMSDGRCLAPCDEWAREEFEKVRRNKAVIVKIEESRNPDFLRLYWRHATLVADACDDFEDRYDADFYARSHMRWMIREMVMADGRTIIRFNSIALHRMGEAKFRNFYDRAVHLWSLKLGYDAATLLAEAAAAAAA